MRRQPRPLLLGALAAAVTLAGLAGWMGVAPREALTAETPPRLAAGPAFERCVGLLRRDPEGALAHAEQWAREGGGEGAAHCQALALLGLGQLEQAAQRLETLASQSRAANPARAAIYAQATQAWLLAGEINRAFASATLALTLAPDDVDLLVDRAVVHGNLSRYGEAIEDLDRALTLDPTRAEALVFRAAAHRHRDEKVLAARDIDLALSLQADNAEALLERGILRQLQGDAAGARADWERAVRVAPGSPAADLAAQNLALNEAGPARR
ncbi:tetratricopeptide repeat protein [Falsiroseomonas sp. HC035]|uniref:tetratricopeptide repeat protein n=1 Tax=Falsiroseomonas sp. HC035 TaxID=3390999 RepID=UPI003D312D38